MKTTVSKSITVSQDLQLEAVSVSDQTKLLSLMMEIYRPIYQHLWYDDGSGYVQSQFNLENLKVELDNPLAHYYFVVSGKETIGILRFIMNQSTHLINHKNTTKLHRIYLNPTAHGKGYGGQLIDWLSAFARINKQQSIWLESMDTQQAAINFYECLGFETYESFILDSPRMRPERRGMLRMKLDL